MSKSNKTPPENESIPSHSKEKGNAVNASDFAVGCKLEACDVSGLWYPARVESVDWKKKDILVHFDRWNTKFDEWIPMNSPRLRSVTKPAPKKPPVTFKRGQHVLASWSAYQRYPAIVQAADLDGKYKVLFEDGCVKLLPPGKMWQLEDSSSSPVAGPVGIGSKQDRRDRKRKLIVSELFRSNKRPKLSEPSERKKLAVASTSSPSDKPVAELTPRKSLPVTLAPPTPIEVTYVDGHTEEWTRTISKRSEGKTAGKVEIVIAAGNGRKFRAKPEVARFCEENDIIYDATLFDFSAKNRGNMSKKLSETKVGTEEAQSPGVEAAEMVPPAMTTAPVLAAALSAEPLPLGEEKKFIGGLEVLVLDGQFICPVTDCRKHFRKENLLHMHMKHYHPDLSKYLDYTPSVTDLAYARTVQEGSPGPRPVGRPDLRSTDIKRSPLRIKDCRVDLKAIPVTPTPETPPVAPAPAPEAVEEPAKPEPEVEVPAPAPAPAPSVVEVSADLAAPEAVTPCEPLDGATGDLESVIPATVVATEPTIQARTKHHWKRRPYHRTKLPTPDWYGRVSKASVSGAGLEASGKQKGAEPKDLVQRNPILNTLLSSRPLVPTLGWRTGWRRRRRGGWKKRRQPRVTHLLPPPPPAPLTDVMDGLDDSRQSIATEGSDLSKSPALLEGEKLEKLRGNEIINCTCQVKEEDGLMIQCDVCQCWQHGHCLGLTPQADMPGSYACSICKDPPKGRLSRKYVNHQDWLKQGILPCLPFQSSTSARRQALLKRACEQSGQLSLMSRLLHSLRVKLSVAKNKEHPKLWLWARKWQETVKPLLPEVKDEDPSTPKAPEPEKPIDPIECKLNLLEHIQHYHDLIQQRLDALETQITELEELQDDAAVDEPADNCPRTSATVKMVLRDLDTVRRVANLP